MRILMLNNEYPPLGGGQASANKSILDELQANEYRVSVDLITSSINEFRIENTQIGKIFYLNIGKKNKNPHHQNVKNLLRYSIKAFLFSRKKILQRPYELIIAWSGIPAGCIAYLLNRIYKVPYILLLRGSDVPFHEAKWKILDTFIFQFLSPVIWKNAEKVIANSKELRTLALKSSKNQTISVIENGVDYDFWNNGATKQLTDFSKKIILSVGRISKIKGFDIAIRAISEIKIENIEYWIVGDGPEKQKLQMLAQKLNCAEKVKFLGVKSKTELRDIYHNSTIFCLPSYNEGMSNALVEAMACGLPVIVTNVGGTSELVNENGVIIEKGDSKSLEQAINVILSNTDNYMKLSAKSVKISSKKSWENRTLDFLSEIERK